MNQQQQKDDKIICNGCQQNNRISHQCKGCGSYFCVNCLTVLFGQKDQYLCPTCPNNKNLVLFNNAWKNVALQDGLIQYPAPKKKVNHEQIQWPQQPTQKKFNIGNIKIKGVKQIKPHEQNLPEIQVNLPYDKNFLFLPASNEKILIQQQCQNYDSCGQNTHYNFCSIECYITDKFLIVLELNKKDDQKELREFCVSQLPQMSEPKIQQICDSYYTKCNLSRFQMIATQEVQGSFGKYFTHISTVYFESGIHYWEFKCNGNAKIGVCGQISDVCFSDRKDGWAYFTKGQLRNGSDSYGRAYGQRLKQDIPIGVLLNMNEGQLSFFIDRVYEGVAFVDDRLKVGPLYAAIATQDTSYQLIFPEGMPKSVLNIIKQ